MTTDTSEIINGLRVIVQALRVASRQAERTSGLSGAQLFVLSQLASAESLSLNGLAVLTHTHQSSVSVVVAKLVEEKLVSRAKSKTDARQLVLSLTAKGRKNLERAPKTGQDMLFEGLRAMKKSERAALSKHLNTLILKAGMKGTAPQLFFESLAKPEKT
jgi:DNA-binding MarR family transcriptional regulator